MISAETDAVVAERIVAAAEAAVPVAFAALEAVVALEAVAVIGLFAAVEAVAVAE